MKIYTSLLLAAAAVSMLSCQSGEKQSEADTFGAGEIAGISAEGYSQYVAALASDELEGRKPFTNGEKKTLAYLEQEFKALGLEPGNGDSYLQEVPMVEISTTAAPTMTISGAKNMALQGLQDYVIWTKRTDESITLKNEALVFAGFGIVAPEYNRNDYAGLDVKDKVVVVFVSDPGFYSQDSTYFKGRAMTYYGRWTYKFEEAARQGAKGCLIVHDTTPAGYGFQVVQNSWNTSKLYLDPRGKDSYKCAVEGWVTKPVAEQLFAASGLTYETALAAATKPGFTPKAMNLQLSTSLTVKAKYDKSYNVIAKISGSEKPDEAIIYSAHWDHLGIDKPDEKGDSIYNGAVDNASGVAALLEMAKAFKAKPEQPKRSVVFLSVTAEEQGLWGSAYYAENPVFAKEKTVANINVDMLIPAGKTKDIVLVGKGQSELEDMLAEEAEKVGRYVAAEAAPEAGLYYRSDHFNFAKIGIPAMFTAAGIDDAAEGKAHGQQVQESYVANTYHKPSDEYNSNWKTDGAIEDIKLLFYVGSRLANSNSWPGWKAGSEFKAVREAYKK